MHNYNVQTGMQRLLERVVCWRVKLPALVLPPGAATSNATKRNDAASETASQARGANSSYRLLDMSEGSHCAPVPAAPDISLRSLPAAAVPVIDFPEPETLLSIAPQSGGKPSAPTPLNAKKCLPEARSDQRLSPARDGDILTDSAQRRVSFREANTRSLAQARNRGSTPAHIASSAVHPQSPDALEKVSLGSDSLKWKAVQEMDRTRAVGGTAARDSAHSPQGSRPRSPRTAAVRLTEPSPTRHPSRKESTAQEHTRDPPEPPGSVREAAQAAQSTEALSSLSELVLASPERGWVIPFSSVPVAPYVFAGQRVWVPPEAAQIIAEQDYATEMDQRKLHLARQRADVERNGIEQQRRMAVLAAAMDRQCYGHINGPAGTESDDDTSSSSVASSDSHTAARQLGRRDTLKQLGNSSPNFRRSSHRHLDSSGADSLLGEQPGVVRVGGPAKRRVLEWGQHLDSLRQRALQCLEESTEHAAYAHLCAARWGCLQTGVPSDPLERLLRAGRMRDVDTPAPNRITTGNLQGICAFLGIPAQKLSRGRADLSSGEALANVRRLPALHSSRAVSRQAKKLAAAAALEPQAPDVTSMALTTIWTCQVDLLVQQVLQVSDSLQAAAHEVNSVEAELGGHEARRLADTETDRWLHFKPLGSSLQDRELQANLESESQVVPDTAAEDVLTEREGNLLRVAGGAWLAILRESRFKHAQALRHKLSQLQHARRELEAEVLASRRVLEGLGADRIALQAEMDRTREEASAVHLAQNHEAAEELLLESEKVVQAASAGSPARLLCVASERYGRGLGSGTLTSSEATLKASSPSRLGLLRALGSSEDDLPACIDELRSAAIASARDSTREACAAAFRGVMAEGRQTESEAISALHRAEEEALQTMTRELRAEARARAAAPWQKWQLRQRQVRAASLRLQAVDSKLQALQDAKAQEEAALCSKREAARLSVGSSPVRQRVVQRAMCDSIRSSPHSPRFHKALKEVHSAMLAVHAMNASGRQTSCSPGASPEEYE